MTVVLPLTSGQVARETDPASTAWGEDVRIVVWLSGEQDISTAADLTERLDAAAALGNGNLIVDVSQVEFIDAATVRVIVHCVARLRLQSRWLRLRHPQPFVQRVLGICGLADLVDPGPTATPTGNGSLVTFPRPG
jgi:anti-anti-sigma factor